jgi:phosphoribosylanthranilate isomerase
MPRQQLVQHCGETLLPAPLPPLFALAEAVATAAPTGVDVSSGVCGPDGMKKDAGKVQRYCAAAAAALQRRRQEGAA